MKKGYSFGKCLNFNLTNTELFNIFRNTIDKTNFLIWAGLRHAVPHELKNMNPLRISLFYVINKNVFLYISKKISKHYY